MVHVHGGSGAGATMAPEGKDNIKGEACLGCKRNVFRVKMHAKPQLIIFQSIRDAKILWFSCGVFDTLVGAS